MLLLVEKEYDGNKSKFARAFNVSHGALTAWFNEAAPTPPSVPFLLAFARRHRVSLDGLLLGRRPLYWRFQRLTATPRKAMEPGPGWVREKDVQRLIQQLARGAVDRMERERAQLLQQMKQARRSPRRASARKRASQRRRKA